MRGVVTHKAEMDTCFDAWRGGRGGGGGGLSKAREGSGGWIGHNEGNKVLEMLLAMPGVVGQVVDGGGVLVGPATRVEGQALEERLGARVEEEGEGHGLALVGVWVCERDAVDVVEGVLIEEREDEAEEGAGDEEEGV